MIRATTIAMLAAAATPALAHPGDHAGFDFAALAAHVFEPDHIIFATLAGIIGVLAYKAGRRAEARARTQEVRNDPR